MKSFFVKLLCLLGLIGCSNNVNNTKYLYNTKEYNDFVKESIISLDDAIKIICDAIEKKVIISEDDKNFNANIHFSYKKTATFKHYFLLNNSYVFVHVIPQKFGLIDITTSIYINSKTGELTQHLDPSGKNKQLEYSELSYEFSCNNK